MRKVFQRSKNVRIRLTELKQVVPSENRIITDSEDIYYDKLVLAMGADTNWFGNTKLAEHAFPMKSTVEALQIRHRLLQLFEDAHSITDPVALQRIMNIVVVGGGPTGVEVSGALSEMKRYVLPKDYPELDFSKMNIYLLEGSPKTLGTMSDKSAEQSRKYLERLGVKVMTNTMVKDYDGNEVILPDGSRIPAATVIWAAGVKGNVPEGLDKDLITKGNRLKVDRHCLVQGFNNVYAIGDLAYMETPKYPTGHPQVAAVAIQHADLLASNFRIMERKSSPDQMYEFEYYDKGSMATVGRNLAVVDLPRPKLHFGGFFAWLIWMGLHLILILGVKNKISVFFNWVWSYLTYDQNLRLIFREFYKPTRKVGNGKEKVESRKLEIGS